MKILIMAGGSGERFWPLSTKHKPKQLLSLFSNKTLIRETVDRALSIVNFEDIYIATNKIQSKNIISELRDIPEKNIIIEPDFRDTAAAIAYGGLVISRDSKKDEVIAVLASDHLISNNKLFKKNLLNAEEIAKKDFIVTLGVKPDSPKTGFGYIKLDDFKINKATKAIKFTEKPNIETAQKYFDSGNYVWNSGMFVFKYDTMIKELNKFIPNHVFILEEIRKVMGYNVGIKLSNIAAPFFSQFKKISIDFAIMEKSDLIQCIPVDFGWNDVGDFRSLEYYIKKDRNNNIIKDVRYICMDSTNNIILSDQKNKIISSIGLNNMIVVDTKKALLICKKEESQKIKELVKKIN
jgi:mannose-1-phosphate guanylyltransferase